MRISSTITNRAFLFFAGLLLALPSLCFTTSTLPTNQSVTTSSNSKLSTHLLYAIPKMPKRPGYSFSS